MSTTDHRLSRLMDAPSFARVVPHLAPETLHQLIHLRGLDACGELVTAATPAQRTALLDLDLWRNAQPGRDEQFDAERFGEWLEVLVGTGESVAARIVAALDQQVVIAGLSRYLRVFDPGTFEPHESNDDEAIERHDRMNRETSRDVVECEVGGYTVRARRTDAWDAIVTLLVTLETEHHDCFHVVMQGCRGLSNSRPEMDGFYDLLLAPEQHLQDVTIEREQRRSRQGYATPAEARAFLQMARQPQHTVNPIAAAYFRATEEDAVEAVAPVDTIASPEQTLEDEAPTSIEAVIELLSEAGVMPAQPRALLSAGAGDPRDATLPILKRLMQFVLQHDETAYLERTRELAFVANILLSGCSVQSRPFTPQEASDAAASICNLGLECWPDTAMLPDAFLVTHDLVKVFEVGWSALYRDVSLFVADQLISTLTDLRRFDTDTRLSLLAFQRSLEKHGQAGTPWLARSAADVLAMLDMTAWVSVCGLLDECPVLPSALTAVLERSTTPVNPAAFEFISAKAQIGDVRLFMRTLPNLLSR